MGVTPAAISQMPLRLIPRDLFKTSRTLDGPVCSTELLQDLCRTLDFTCGPITAQRITKSNKIWHFKSHKDNMLLSGNTNAVHNAVHKRSTHQIAKNFPIISNRSVCSQSACGPHTFFEEVLHIKICLINIIIGIKNLILHIKMYQIVKEITILKAICYALLRGQMKKVYFSVRQK